MPETPIIQQYLQLRSGFMGYLYAITRDAELAEEIYQNAAVVILEKAEQQETIRNFHAWAKEVVRRQALHAIHAREVSSQKTRTVSPELLDVVSDTFLNDASDPSTAPDEGKALKQCLDGLTEDKRELVALRYEGGRSFEEISSQIGSTPNAVQRSLSRIRKKLHDCVQHRLQFGEGAS